MEIQNIWLPDLFLTDCFLPFFLKTPIFINKLVLLKLYFLAEINSLAQKLESLTKTEEEEEEEGSREEMKPRKLKERHHSK